MAKNRVIFFITFVFFNIFLQKNIFSYVRVDTSCKISFEENKYNNLREPYIKVGLSKFLNNLNVFHKKLPRIDFCFSGGGYRAMITSLGFMVGAQKIGLLDTATSIGAISGGTWFLIPWIMNKKSPSQYVPELRKKVNGFSFYNPLKVNWKHVLRKLKHEYVHKGEVKVVDFYGALIAENLFGNFGELGQYINFEDLKRILLKNYNFYPFPICAATIDSCFPYEILEINPFCSGSDFLGGYIPTFAFNSNFYGGVSQQNIFFPESLGTFLGLCGSAYSISIWDIIKNLGMMLSDRSSDLFNLSKFEKIELKGFIDFFIKLFFENRIFFSNFKNFTYGMQNSPLSNLSKLTLSDGGMLCNLPVIPLLKRGSDIIIICDSELEVPNKKKSELTWAKLYAERHGYKFPSIKNPKKISEYIYVYEDKDPDTPTLIYFENPIKESTLKFNYSPEEFDKLCSSVSCMVVDHKSVVVDVIKRKIKKLNSIGYKVKKELGF
ncbi:hypothetical protein ACFLYH_01585 [Candidatus Dependentiae bacterium]